MLSSWSFLNHEFEPLELDAQLIRPHFKREKSFICEIQLRRSPNCHSRALDIIIKFQLAKLTPISLGENSEIEVTDWIWSSLALNWESKMCETWLWWKNSVKRYKSIDWDIWISHLNCPNKSPGSTETPDEIDSCSVQQAVLLVGGLGQCGCNPKHFLRFYLVFIGFWPLMSIMDNYSDYWPGYIYPWK